MRNSIKVFLLVISMSWAANAYLVPGQPGGGGSNRPAPYPGGPGGGHGGDHGHGGGGITPGPYPHPQPPHQNPGYPNQPYPGNPHPSDPYPGQPYPPSSPAPGYGAEVKSIWIGRNVMNENISLRDMAGIGRQYSGWEVVSVRANVRPNNPGRTVAQLVSDGQVVATQINPGYQINLVPSFRLVLSDYSYNLVLAIGGGTYIDDIQIELRRSGGGGYNPNPGYDQNIEISIYRSVYGNDRIDLTQYVDLYRYRGFSIRSVIVTATARYNTGFVSLLVNGLDMGRTQFSGGYSQSSSIFLNRQVIIGQGADSLVLYTQGDMTIERVTLVVR